MSPYFGVKRSGVGSALLAGLAAYFASASESSAAEPSPIPIVVMSEEGPDRQLPTREAFYLSGSAGKEVLAVYPVFVRVEFPPLGIAGDRSCSLALRSLSADQLRKVKSTPLLETRAGVFSIEELWAPPPAAAGAAAIEEYARLRDWHDAYVPPAWVRPSTPEGRSGDEAAEYKVLVSEPRFFRPGGTYCLFLYERHAISEQEKKRIPKLLVEHRRDREACDEKGGDAPRCASTADKELIEGVNKLLSDAGRERAKEVLFKVRTSLVNAAGVLSAFPKEIRTALDLRAWKPMFKLRDDGAPQWSPPRDLLDVDADPLGRLLVELLASKGHIHRGVVPQRSTGDVVNGKKIDCAKDKDACRGRVVYSTRSGSFPIRFVRVRPGLEAFEVASDKNPSAEQRDEIPVSAASLPIYGAGITLEEAIEFARARVKLGGRYLSFADIYGSVIAPFIKKQEEGLEKTGQLGKPEPIKELAARVEAARGAISASCAGAESVRRNEKDKLGGPAKPPAYVLATDRMPFEPAVAALTGLWLEEAALSECAPYASPARDPLASLAELLEGYIDAVLAWTENEDSMTVQVTKISTEHPRRTPFFIQGRMTQETFFDNYVTPYLGRSILVKPGDDIGMTYAGIQVYLWPNEVREPMWSNGASDLRRLAGFEFGVGLLGDDFGEENRFSGLGPLPPLFVGAALHTLPYVTLSLGASLMERRRSALIPETSQFYASFYVGVTAQLNAVGIVRNLASGRGSSMAEEK